MLEIKETQLNGPIDPTSPIKLDSSSHTLQRSNSKRTISSNNIPHIDIDLANSNNNNTGPKSQRMFGQCAPQDKFYQGINPSGIRQDGMPQTTQLTPMNSNLSALEQLNRDMKSHITQKFVIGQSLNSQANSFSNSL